MKCHRSLSASCRTLDHHDPVLGISDDRILLFLNRTDNILKLNFSVAAKLCFQNLIVNLHIAFKLIDHFSIADLILPFGSNLTVDLTHRCFIGSRSLIIVIKQTTHRRTPVIYQRNMPRLLRKVSDSNIKNLRFVLSFVNEIHSSKERRIYHPAKSLLQDQLFFICGNLTEQCLLVIIIFIAILVHLCIIFPVILMHSLDFLLAFYQRKTDLRDAFF